MHLFGLEPLVTVTKIAQQLKLIREDPSSGRHIFFFHSMSFLSDASTLIESVDKEFQKKVNKAQQPLLWQNDYKPGMVERILNEPDSVKVLFATEAYGMVG